MRKSSLKGAFGASFAMPRAVLPGTTIVASSPTVAGIRTTVSDAQGDYRLTDLPPGEYTITGELQGFSGGQSAIVAIHAEFPPNPVSVE
jgi:hypothetical protein